MKKIIGTLMVVAMAFGVFYSTISINATNDIKLASLISMNSAEAECPAETFHPGAFCKNNPTKNDGYCTVTPTKTSCLCSTAHNKDCYDVGF